MSGVELYAGAIAGMNAKMTQALKMTADAIMGDLRNAGTIPRDIGILQGEAMYTEVLELGRVVVCNDTAYARRLYYHPEYNFSREQNLNAGALWFEPYCAGGDRNAWVLETFAKMCTKVGL